ncbi:MAG: zf-HC2 domain-containing protein [Gemmatimonadales bacterium]
MDRLDRYTCDEALRRLEDFLDGELSAEQVGRMQAHLDSCVPCTSQFTFEASVVRGIRERLQRTDLPPDLLARIRRMLDGAGGAA